MGEYKSNGKSVQWNRWVSNGSIKANVMKNSEWANCQIVRTYEKLLLGPYWIGGESKLISQLALHFVKLMHHDITDLTVHSSWATVWEYSMFFVVKDSIIDS